MGLFWFHFSGELDSICVSVRVDRGEGGDSHFSIHVPLLHAQVELWMHLLMEDVVVIDRFFALLFAIEVDEAYNPNTSRGGV